MNAQLQGWVDPGGVEKVVAIRVTLSVRNLQTLQTQLDLGLPGFLGRTLSDGTSLSIVVESDVTHYNTDERLAQTDGEMGIGPEDVT